VGVPRRWWRGVVLGRYEDLVLKYQDVDVRVDVVFGFDQLIEKYLGGQAAVQEARERWEARRKGGEGL